MARGGPSKGQAAWEEVSLGRPGRGHQVTSGRDLPVILDLTIMLSPCECSGEGVGPPNPKA